MRPAPLTSLTARPKRGIRFSRLQPYLYILPATLFVCTFLLYPMVYTLWQSFTDSNGLTALRAARTALRAT